mmetsp:Transcript_136406/g.308251  ORF Transcript_136406/g.308251 Transcript_136406/m.308251 type:complete len:268 (-) Transcript_136406:285-1088(-)
MGNTCGRSSTVVRHRVADAPEKETTDAPVKRKSPVAEEAAEPPPVKTGFAEPDAAKDAPAAAPAPSADLLQVPDLPEGTNEISVEAKAEQLKNVQNMSEDERKQLEKERKERRKQAKDATRKKTGAADATKFLSEMDAQYVNSAQMVDLKSFISKNREKSDFVSSDDYQQQVKKTIQENLKKIPSGDASTAAGTSRPPPVAEGDEGAENELEDAMAIFSPDIPFQARFAEFEYLMSKRAGVAEHVATETAKMKEKNKKSQKNFMSMA